MATEEQKKLSLLADDLVSLENYIHDLFNFSPLPICFVSPIGAMLEVNPSFERLAGLKSYELIGESIDKLFSKDEVHKLAKRTLEKEFVEGKEMFFFPRGKEKIAVHAFTRVRKDEKGESVGYFLGLFDLTSIKKAEGDLMNAQTSLVNILEDTEEARVKAEEEKRKTQEIIRSLADGLLVFDKEDRLTVVNPTAEGFIQIPKERLIGKSVASLVLLPETKKLAKLIGDADKHLIRHELKIEENFTLEVSTIPLMSEGTRIGRLIVLHDVSREKIIERMKTEFVSISAHQLRTPLSAIKWTLRMLLDGDLGAITKDQRTFIEKTYESNEKMITLINDLLNVTRIEEGRYLYKPALHDLRKIIKSMLSMYEEEALKRGIKFQLRLTKKKIPKVLVDVEKIKLAFQNLIDNSIRYTPSGGKVTVSLGYDNQKEIIVSVEDNGVGIPKAQQERIFTKFFRGSNVTRMETDGSGLGLFISKNIIESHGGRIWFKSKEKKGTTFYFSIPTRKKNK